MEALEFLKLYRRYCKSYSRCGLCPLESSGCIRHKVMSAMTDKEIDNLLITLEEFKKSHPTKTLLQKLLEEYPNIPLREYDGTPLSLCPSHIGYPNISQCTGGMCIECWSQEVEISERE